MNTECEALLIGSLAPHLQEPANYSFADESDADFILPNLSSNTIELLAATYPELTREYFTFPRALFDKLYHAEGTLDLGAGLRVISIADWYTLKASHMAWDINWAKHIKQLVHSLQFNAHKTRDDGLWEALTAYWVKSKKQRQADIDWPSNDKLFEDNVDRPWPHDLIHMEVANSLTPAYLFLKEDLDAAVISKAKWDEATYEMKVELIFQELATLTLERYLLVEQKPSVRLHPHLEAANAWKNVIKLYCVSLAPLWVLKFFFENLDKFVEPPVQLLDHIRRSI